MPSTFLQGGGEMGALMRATDWDATPVGAPARWPQSLRTAVSLVLEAKFPMLLCWGPRFIQFYNDPFRPILGATKHPAIGKSTRDTFPEAWHIIGPLFDRVMAGEAVGFEDMLVPLDRYGFLEDCYFSYSYSPIRGEDGQVAGVFVTCTETTGRVVGERRLRLLQELAVQTVADQPDDVCRRAVAVLARGTSDVPFAAIHLLDEDGVTLRRVAACGNDAEDCWPVDRARDSGTLIVAETAEKPPQRAFVVPILASGGAAAGVLVAGARSTLPIDDQYRGFVTLIARGIGTSLASARALADEKRRTEALAEIDRAKTTFFSNVSHEFRTPLTLLLGPIEDALDRGDKALEGDELAMVHRNALRLLNLVNTLLDFARIEADRARVTFETVDLAQLTADLASTFRSAMTRAGLRFEVACAPLPSLVAVDRAAWEKIVLNLLSNALKFTFDGSVNVSLRQRDDGQIELQVRDTGVGIPAEEIPRLFDRFHRVQGARGRTHEGSGIGLALVHELVKMHGGSLSVTSEPGRGALFAVTIPARRVDGEAIGEPRAPAITARPYVEEALRWLPDAAGATAIDALRVPGGDVSGRPRILLADDNRDVRDYIVRLLSPRYTVETVRDGITALEAARRAPPALIITDVMMPRLDGFGLLRALRADPITHDVPVIMLSARAGEDASLEGLAAGADDYLAKPFSARDLRARVDAQVHRAEMRAAETARDRQIAEMFRLAPVALAMLQGPEHLIEFVNDEYMRVVGRRDLAGRNLLDAIPELIDQGIGALLDQVYRSGQPYAADSLRVTLHRGLNAAAEPAYFNFVFQPIDDAYGKVERIAIVAVEVTELAQARVDAEAANRAKDQFLAVLGHELRNPLAPILTATRLLELQGPRDPQLQKLRATITRQATHMLKLVEDLLDVGRIITGKLRLQRTDIEIGVLLKQAAEAASSAIERGGHTLTLSLPEAPIHVDADAARMTQVISNLLHNAAKFMPQPGQISVVVSGSGGTVAIRVRDEGIGIPADMLERVFDRFVQAAAFDDNRYSQGLGIGLSLVKTIVELHGGSVIAASDGPGTGAEFTLMLPVAAPIPSHAVATL